MDSTYLIVAGLCLIGLTIRTSYESLKKLGRVDTENKALFAVVFLGMCIMLASWPVMSPSDPWRIDVPGVARWIGLGAVAVALALAMGGLVQRGLENIELVTTGLYSKLRHPMYVGFILWIVGWVVCYGAVVSSAIAVVGVGNVLYWRHLEEVSLGSRYGEDYLAYRRETWF